MQKLFLALFALVASTAADVSHLSREYLPPVQHDHHAQHGGAAATHFGSISGSSAGASAGPSGTVTYTSQQHSFDYGQQAVAAAAPAAEEPAVSEPVAPADDGPAVAYGSYDAGDQQQYQFVPEAQQQVDAGVGGGNAGVVGADGGSGVVDVADGAFSGSYDLGAQDAGVQDVADNSLSDSYGNSVAHVSLAAAQGPTIRAPQPAISHAASHDAVAEYVSAGAGAGFGGSVSGSSGLDTQYGSNGGYIY